MFACSDKKQTILLPKPPGSIETIQKNITGKQFASSRIALLLPFELNDNPSYEWLDERKDTTSFFQTFLAEREKFRLSFYNDTAVSIFDDNKSVDGIYKIDNKQEEDEKQGFKLRISFIDTSVKFAGITEPIKMTYTYLVAGIDENNLLLELPRHYNNRKVFTLLESQ